MVTVLQRNMVAIDRTKEQIIVHAKISEVHGPAGAKQP